MTLLKYMRLLSPLDDLGLLPRHTVMTETGVLLDSKVATSSSMRCAVRCRQAEGPMCVCDKGGRAPNSLMFQVPKCLPYPLASLGIQ